MPDFDDNSSENAGKTERYPLIQKEQVMKQIGAFLFRQGLIDIREKKKFDEMIKK
ncbi:MAG: hypothetical protein QM657_06785 [Lacrimispora sp.]|uniref:hypothetical protein n=1 Tax=Lacrimispora sp. TaxID=2719234 RepID=UPI0039E51D54